MKLRLLILIVMMFTIVSILFSCNKEEEIVETSYIQYKEVLYARDLFFSWKIMIDGEPFIATNWFDRNTVFNRLWMRDASDQPYYTELIFVRNEAEAVGFPDSTVLAWPEEGFGQGMVNGLHLGMLRGDIDLEDFGLSYPITIQNLVDDWENVNRLMRYIVDERGLMGSLSFYGPPFDANAYMLEIEAFRLLEDKDAVDRVLLRGREWWIPRRDTLELLHLVGSEEAFFDAMERMEEEGLSFEELMEELEGENN